jgi:hypothetical protein
MSQDTIRIKDAPQHGGVGSRLRQICAASATNTGVWQEGSQLPALSPEAFGHGRPGAAEMGKTKIFTKSGTMPNAVAAGDSQLMSVNLDGAIAFPDAARLQRVKDVGSGRIHGQSSGRFRAAPEGLQNISRSHQKPRHESAVCYANTVSP